MLPQACWNAAIGLRCRRPGATVRGTSTHPRPVRPNGDTALRIALLTYRGNPRSGGQGVYVRHLSRGLRDLGHAVTVISGPPYPELDEGVALKRLRGLDLYSRIGEPISARSEIRHPVDAYEYLAVKGGFFPEPLAFGMRALAYLRHNNGFDVVHDNQSLSYGLLGMQRLGLPVVATIHHPIHIDRKMELAAAPTWRDRLKLRRWYSFLWMQGFVSRRLPIVISVSKSSGRETERAFGVAQSRIRTVYNGVDAGLFASRPAAPRRPDRVLVVNSADTPIKGLEHLYGAIARLLHRRTAEVVIVGQPKDADLTRRELERLGIGASVRFLGTLDRDALVEAYSSAAVAVLPSLYEGFGFPAAEAMSCEVPVVAYAAGAVPEVVGPDGVAGRLVPTGDQEALADAIAGILDDPDGALRMGVAGRERVLELFTWERAARETAALYEEALSC